jgi:hypothetical protein
LIRVHNDATSDLGKIRAIDPLGFSRLVAFIQQLKVDLKLVDKLLDHNFGRDGSEDISVSKWLNIYKVERLPVWRLKSWDLEDAGLKYRIIYCYNYQDRSHNIMAVVPRGGINYDDPEHPIRKRVIRRVREEFPNA